MYRVTRLISKSMLGPIGSEREFLIFDNDGESIVMGVQWHNDLIGNHRMDNIDSL